jgi:tetratricopeptide (TPR) repeat protein
MKLVYSVAILFVAVTCSTKPRPVAIGVNGREFFEPVRSADQQNLLDKNLDEAKKNFDNDPSEENYIWYGRREGYLLHFQRAIEIFSEGIEKYPDSYRLYRHRGHRYISSRNFDKAIADLTTATRLVEGKPLETEPDGIPNKLGIAKSTTQSNIWYHLGLAYYLQGDYKKAAEAYEESMKYADNDDLVVATTDWLFMTYYRLGRANDAKALLEKIQPQMSIIENETYHKRLLMYKSEYQPELLLAVQEAGVEPEVAIATQGYGVGNWYLIQGDTARATDVFKKVIGGSSFSAFGFIAAEVDLQRLKKE